MMFEGMTSSDVLYMIFAMSCFVSMVLGLDGLLNWLRRERWLHEKRRQYRERGRYYLYAEGEGNE